MALFGKYGTAVFVAATGASAKGVPRVASATALFI
jgi:hypothetical protein